MLTNLPAAQHRALMHTAKAELEIIRTPYYFEPWYRLETAHRRKLAKRGFLAYGNRRITADSSLGQLWLTEKGVAYARRFGCILQTQERTP